VLDRSLEEMRVTLLATVARCVGAPGDAFEPIDVFTALSACAKLLRPYVDVRVELVRIIESRHHNVSSSGSTAATQAAYGCAERFTGQTTSRQGVENQRRRRQ
jgi:hypothetical protein